MGLLERSPQALLCSLIDAATSQKHSVNRLCVRDVLQGVGTEDHQISTATLSDHADIFLDLKEPSSVSSGDTDHVQRRDASRYEKLEPAVNVGPAVIHATARSGYPRPHLSAAASSVEPTRLQASLPRSHLRFSPTRQNPKPVPT